MRVRIVAVLLVHVLLLVVVQGVLAVPVHRHPHGAGRGGHRLLARIAVDAAARMARMALCGGLGVRRGVRHARRPPATARRTELDGAAPCWSVLEGCGGGSKASGQQQPTGCRRHIAVPPSADNPQAGPAQRSARPGAGATTRHGHQAATHPRTAWI